MLWWRWTDNICCVGHNYHIHRRAQTGVDVILCQRFSKIIHCCDLVIDLGTNEDTFDGISIELLSVIIRDISQLN